MRRKGEITHNSFFLPFLFFVDFFSFLFLRTRHERKDLSPFAFGGVTMSSSSAVKLGDFSIFFDFSFWCRRWLHQTSYNFCCFHLVQVRFSREKNLAWNANRSITSIIHKRMAGIPASIAKVVNYVSTNSEVLHYALIPLIIVVGMRTTPRPDLISLLTPV